MEKKIADNKELKLNVKSILLRAKEKNLIKPHILAFENTPVSQEEHKGRLESYKRK